MNIRTPVKHCPMCGSKISGRSDKIYCSVKCKSQYHLERKAQHLPFTSPIDKILHRNWIILTEYYEITGTRKFFVSKAELNKAGFHINYFTTIHTNAKGKTYYYVYNFGWMEFSETEMMVVRLSRPK